MFGIRLDWHTRFYWELLCIIIVSTTSRIDNCYTGTCNSFIIVSTVPSFPTLHIAVERERHNYRFHTSELYDRRRNRSRNYDDDGDDDDESDIENKLGIRKQIPQLPASRSILSSNHNNNTSTASSSSSSSYTIPLQLHKKLQLQYTCNVCETRNVHSISRIAYNNGVVIARCKGCDSQHLIADHLGWTNYKGGFEGPDINTIEDYFVNQQQQQQQQQQMQQNGTKSLYNNDDAENGRNNNSTSSGNTIQNDNVVVVNRVTQEVFELEKMIRQYDMNSGSIIGNDGQLAME
jgi:DNL zinc finger